MNETIQRILRLSGDMPDAGRYRLYLEGLKPQAVLARLNDLEVDALREHHPYHLRRPHVRKGRRADLFTEQPATI